MRERHELTPAQTPYERPVGIIEAAAIAVAGALIGFAWAWQPAYWHDEAATLSAVDRSAGQLWDMLGNVGAFNSLYYFAMHPWLGLFGAGEVATRLFSAIGLAVTCLATVYLGQRLDGRALGLTAGGIAALLPGLSWAGAETRVYSWNCAAAVVATILLMRAQESDRVGRWAAYIAVMILMAYLFILSMLLLLAHVVTLLILRRIPRWWWVYGIAIAGAMLPLVVFAGEERERTDYADENLFVMTAKAALRQNFLSTRADDGVGIALVCAVVLLLIAVLLAGMALRGLPDEPAKTVVAVTLPWAVLPTVVLIGYSQVGSTLYQERYLTFCAPAVALIMGFGLLQARGRHWIFMSLCALLLLLPWPILVQQKEETSRSGQDYRRLAEFVEDHASAVIFGQPDSRSLQAAYPESFRMLEQLNQRKSPVEADNYWGRLAASTRLEADDVAGHRVALVTRTELEADAYGDRLLAFGCTPTDSARGSQLRVHVLEC